MMASLNFFQKRPVMDSIGFTIKFINQNFSHLFKSLIIIYLPLYFLLGVLFVIDTTWFGIVTGGWYGWLAQTIRSEIYENVSSDFPIVYIMVSLAYQAISGAYISSAFYSYFTLYSQKEDSNFGMKELFNEMGKNIWSLMGLNAIITIALFIILFFFTRIIMLANLADSIEITYLIGLATLATIIYFLIRMVFIQVLAVAEETNLIAGLERSVELVKNNWWSIFGVMVVNVVFFVVVIAFLMIMPTYLVAENDIFSGQSKQIYLIVLGIVGMILQFLATIYWKTNLFAIYASLYEGKEYKTLYQSVNKLGSKEKEEDNEDF